MDDKPWRDDERPWRAWDEYHALYYSSGADDNETLEMLDSLVRKARAEGQAYEANAQWAQLPRLKAERARADRLAAVLRANICTGGHPDGEHCPYRSCREARAALADSPKDAEPTRSDGGT